METGNGDGTNRTLGITPDERAKSRKIALASYRKRKQCIKKKTMELSTLCDIKACAIIIGKDGDIETWPENQTEVQHMIDLYRNCDVMPKLSPNVARTEKKDKIEASRSMNLRKTKMLSLVDSKLEEVNRRLGSLRKGERDEEKNKGIETTEGLQMTVNKFFKALYGASSSNELIVENTNQINCMWNNDGVGGANPGQGIRPNKRAKPKMIARTYATQLNNIKKKTMELSTICDIKACSIFIGKNGEIETWPENQSEVKDVIDSYRNYDVRAKRTPNVACMEKKDKTEELKRQIEAERRRNLRKAEMLSLIDSKLEYVNERLDSINTGKLNTEKNKGIKMLKGKERLEETVSEFYKKLDKEKNKGIETSKGKQKNKGIEMSKGKERLDETVSELYKKLDKEKNKGIETSKGKQKNKGIEMSNDKERLDETVSEFYKKLDKENNKGTETSNGKQRLDETVSEFYKPLIRTSSSSGLMMQEAREIDFMGVADRNEEKGSDDELPPLFVEPLQAVAWSRDEVPEPALWSWIYKS